MNASNRRFRRSTLTLWMVTPLLVARRDAPYLYDSGLWLDVASCDLDYHVARVDAAAPLTRSEIYGFVEREVGFRCASDVR